MLTRRDFVRYGILAGSGTITGLLAGCAGPRPMAAPATQGHGEQVRSVVSRAAGDATSAASAARSVRAFTADLYRRLSRTDGDLVCSPYSVAVALAMARAGARGATAAEMDRALHASGPQRLVGGLGALDALLAGRSGTVRRADGSTAKVELTVANSLWGQQGIAWHSMFLDALARSYGAGMRLVDYGNPAAARSLINAWAAAETHRKINRLVPDGALDALTRLVLVNALYLKAPWEHPFDKSSTEILPFVRADGSAVAVPTMRTQIRAGRYARGQGWEAAELRYAGNGLAMTVILPDRTTLLRLQNDLDGDRLAQILRSPTPVRALDLQLPKWTFRTRASLNDALAALGMPTAFDQRTADFSGMTSADKLFISAVLHEAFIDVDEDGTEASAATAAVISATSAVAAPVSMVVNRPFLFVIHDSATTTPLFVGRIANPSA